VNLTLKPKTTLTLGGKAGPASTAVAPGERGARPKIQRADPNAVYPESMAELERIDEQYLAELYAQLTSLPPQPYIVLVFQSTAAKNEFLAQTGWGPETITEWLEAAAIAPALGISLPSSKPKKLATQAKPALTLASTTLTLAAPPALSLEPPADDDEHAKQKEAAAREQQNFADTVETTFWLGIAFEHDTERQHFLAQLTWGEPLESIYFCGEEIAHTLGFTITTPIKKLPDWKPPKRLVAMQGSMTE